MRIPTRRIRNQLELGERVFGVTIQLPDPEIVEIAGYVGLDFVWVDAEHGTMDLGDIAQMVRAADAAGIDALVRVPDHSQSFIQRVLDTGATGIIAPNVQTSAQASALVAAAKFAPEGTRGACPWTRAMGHQSPDWAADSRRANSDVLVFALIETAEGVENVDSIAQESGLDGLLFGPFDLSQALGFQGNVDHPEVARLHRRVVAAARAAGIECLSIPGWDAGEPTEVAENPRIFVIGNDRAVLVNAFKRRLLSVRRNLADAQLINRVGISDT